MSWVKFKVSEDEWIRISSAMLRDVQWILYTVHCTLYNVQCTMYIIYCTIYNVYFTLYTVKWMMFTTLYDIQCTLYVVQCTSYAVHCASYNTLVQIISLYYYVIPICELTITNITRIYNWPKVQIALSSINIRRIL